MKDVNDNITILHFPPLQNRTNIVKKFHKYFHKLDQYYKDNGVKCYYNIVNINLTNIIIRNYEYWKSIVLSESNGIFILCRYSSISGDPASFNEFIINWNNNYII